MKRPDVFCWASAIDHSVLDSWLRERRWNVPEDLKYLWAQTGGGDFFESETIFAPFDDHCGDDSVESVNRAQASRGMPQYYLAFHTGLRFSALNLETLEYFFLDEQNYRVLESFPSLEEWYVKGIRPDFSDKYL